MPALPIAALRQTNARLRAVIRRWHSDPNDFGAIQPEVFTGLPAELRQAVEWLGKAPAGSPADADWQREAAEYKTQVEQIGQFLPEIHGRLLAQRARLESVRTHLEAASAWFQGHKKTL